MMHKLKKKMSKLKPSDNIYAATIRNNGKPIKIVRVFKNLELMMKLEKMFTPRRDDAQSK